MKAKAWNIFGVLAMICLHSANLPSIVRIYQGNFNELPPMDYMVILYVGLLAMTIRYYYLIEDKLAVISNLIGVYGNLFVIGAISYSGMIAT